jgi:hypothetical protein
VVNQEDLAAWIALSRSLRTQENVYWTFNGRAVSLVLPGNLRNVCELLSDVEHVFIFISSGLLPCTYHEMDFFARSPSLVFAEVIPSRLLI